MQLAASAIFHPRLIAPKVRRWGLEIQHQMYMWLLQPPVILIVSPPPDFKCNGLPLVFMNSKIACSFCGLLYGNPFSNRALFFLSRPLSSELSPCAFFWKLWPFRNHVFLYCSTVPNRSRLVGGNFQLGLDQFLEKCHVNTMDEKRSSPPQARRRWTSIKAPRDLSSLASST